MLLKIVLSLVAMFALAALELWLFWTLGEWDDRRRRTRDRQAERVEPRAAPQERPHA